MTQTSAIRTLELAERARRDVPYYRDCYAGIDFRTATIEDLPVLEPQRARSAQKSLLSAAAREGPDVAIEYTSGSTGTPLRLHRLPHEIMRAALSLWRARSEIYPDVARARAVQLSTDARAAIEFRSDQLLVLSPFDVRPDRVGRLLDAINASGATWLRGHPAVLGVLAEAARRGHRRFRNPFVFVESNSGPLLDETRALLGETFGCPIVNHYGAREVYTISYECPRGVMHVFEDCVHVEQTASSGDAEAPEVVVSSLIFEAMPFIRYKPGDFVKVDATPCRCGSNAIACTPVGGRTSELIDGTTLLGTQVFHSIAARISAETDIELMQYRVTQFRRHAFLVEVVLDDRHAFSAFAEQFRRHAEPILPGCRFMFETKREIGSTTSLKPQAFVRAIE